MESKKAAHREQKIMSSTQVLHSLIGGGLIGIAATVMLLFNGRTTGISGIVSSSLAKPTKEGLWRWGFVGGLLFGGGITYMIQPELFKSFHQEKPLIILFAGFLVGYGTSLGSGCTSGHGICGLSRFSKRSAVATLTFMLLGFLAAQVAYRLHGGAT